MKMTTPLDKNMKEDTHTVTTMNFPEDDPMLSKVNTLQEAIHELSEKVKTLNAGLKTEIKEDIKKAGLTQTEHLGILEKKILKSQELKYAEISQTIQTNHLANEDRMTKIEAENTNLHTLLDENRVKLLAQNQKTRLIQDQVDQLQKQVAANQTSAELFEQSAMDLIQINKEKAKEAIVLANSVESHGRRWAVRFLGVDLPPGITEKSHLTKLKVLDIIKTKIKLESVELKDIDCSHRVGIITDDNKQTILARFFSRDLADDIAKYRSNLKGSGIIVYEDATMKNRILINNLNRNDDVHQVWQKNGTIWVRLGEGEKKFKITIEDNINEKIAMHKKNPTPEETHQDPGSPTPETPPVTEQENLVDP
jgi:hypothetical protein